MKNQFKIVEKVFYKQITDLGSLTFYVFVMIFCLIIAKTTLFRNLLISLVLVMVVSVLVKCFYFRERPKKQKKNTFLERLDAASFPSIHSMRVFSLAFWVSMLSNNIYLNVYVSIIALAVMYSRVYLKKHYLSDVIGGVVLSAIINLGIWWFV